MRKPLVIKKPSPWAKSPLIAVLPTHLSEPFRERKILQVVSERSVRCATAKNLLPKLAVKTLQRLVVYIRSLPLPCWSIEKILPT